MVFIDAEIILFRLSTKRQDKLPPKEYNIIKNRIDAIFSYRGQAFQQRVLL